MSISASLVKELREKTNAGMMDCKKALEETKGDFEAAVEWLRVKGLASAAKKAGRVASEGTVFAAVKDGVGAIVEINSETDFVAKNDGFKNFVQDIVGHILTTKSDADISTQTLAKTGTSISEYTKDVVAKIGENIVVRRSTRYDANPNSYIHSYIHGEGKIGVLIEVATTNPSSADVKTFTQDVALHIAAMNPMAISSEQIPADVVAKEKEILKAKNLEQGKKAEMIEKIVEGQIRKFLAENCLVDQAFVKNPDVRVGDYLKETAKKAGGDLTIKRFARFELGEGIEKKQVDFAAEVAEQMKGH